MNGWPTKRDALSDIIAAIKDGGLNPRDFDINGIYRDTIRVEDGEHVLQVPDNEMWEHVHNNAKGN